MSSHASYYHHHNLLYIQLRYELYADLGGVVPSPASNRPLAFSVPLTLSTLDTTAPFSSISSCNPREKVEGHERSTHAQVQQLQ